MTDAERAERYAELVAAFKAAGAVETSEPDPRDSVRVLLKHTYDLDDDGHWHVSRWTPEGGQEPSKPFREFASDLVSRAAALSFDVTGTWVE